MSGIDEQIEAGDAPRATVVRVVEPHRVSGRAGGPPTILGRALTCLILAGAAIVAVPIVLIVLAAAVGFAVLLLAALLVNRLLNRSRTGQPRADGRENVRVIRRGNAG